MNLQNLDAMKALQSLSRLGKKERDVKIEETTITLSALDTGDETEVYVACSELQGNAYFYKLKLETLKYSICAVNGKRLDTYRGIDDFNQRQVNKIKSLDEISEVLKTWNENVVTYLFTEFSKLTGEVEKELTDKGITD
jgi:hypothetical protein